MRVFQMHCALAVTMHFREESFCAPLPLTCYGPNRLPTDTLNSSTATALVTALLALLTLTAIHNKDTAAISAAMDETNLAIQ